jgi:hypothetical protein
VLRQELLQVLGALVEQLLEQQLLQAQLRAWEPLLVVLPVLLPQQALSQV